ncbi:MAG TPA: hypothetical protein VJ867_12995 [Gemmatimonadaceae bacterium]|nr:hypothetical protein [Gemmatimonadaceae bacterium]
MSAVVDVPALLVAVVIAAGTTAALVVAHRGDRHRHGWLAAAAVVVALSLIAIVDIARESPRETNFTTPIIAIVLMTLAALGMVRATHRWRWWWQAVLVFVVAFVALFAALLFAASYAGKVLPF